MKALLQDPPARIVLHLEAESLGTVVLLDEAAGAGPRVAVGDLVRIRYADHALFVNQDAALFRRPPILDTTGRVVYQDEQVIELTWETFNIPTQEGPRPRASGVTVHRATIVELQRLAGRLSQG